jgi:hypothetical protein
MNFVEERLSKLKALNLVIFCEAGTPGYDFVLREDRNSFSFWSTFDD